MRRLVLTVLVFLAVGLLPMLCHHVLRGHTPGTTKSSHWPGPSPARNFPQ
jgi:hypothetical protein